MASATGARPVGQAGAPSVTVPISWAPAHAAPQHPVTAGVASAGKSAAAAPAAPLAHSWLRLADFRPSSSLGIANWSAGDLDCLTAAVYYEARGESAAGQAAVAQVVMNRVRDPAFPKTVCGVVYQGAHRGDCQFSFACDGASGSRLERRAWRRSKAVAARALDGYVMTEVGGATHFHVASLGAVWGRQMVRIVQIGEQVFYGRRRHGARTTTALVTGPAAVETAALSVAARS